MVFKDEWQKLPFVVPDILDHSKYSSLLEAFLRYNRNTMLHTEQHKKSLEKHFEPDVSGPYLLRKMLAGAPRALVNFYWFAKRHLPQLPFNDRFPEKCAAAYEELMAEEKKKIVGGCEALYKKVCQKPPETTTPKDEHAALAEAFEQCCKQIRQILDRSECNFKDYKKKMNDWERKRKGLEMTVKKKKENSRPQAEITNSQKRLDDYMSTQPPLQWMLEVRDFMRNPEKIRESKSRVFRCASHLYTRVCPSVGSLVRGSIGPSVHHAFVKMSKKVFISV